MLTLNISKLNILPHITHTHTHTQVRKHLTVWAIVQFNVNILGVFILIHIVSSAVLLECDCEIFRVMFSVQASVCSQLSWMEGRRFTVLLSNSGWILWLAVGPVTSEALGTGDWNATEGLSSHSADPLSSASRTASAHLLLSLCTAVWVSHSRTRLSHSHCFHCVMWSGWGAVKKTNLNMKQNKEK